MIHVINKRCMLSPYLINETPESFFPVLPNRELVGGCPGTFGVSTTSSTSTSCCPLGRRVSQAVTPEYIKNKLSTILRTYVPYDQYCSYIDIAMGTF